MRSAYIFVTLALVSAVVAKCGKGVSGCPSGQCCSYWGYCGSTNDYCGSAKTQCVCDCKGSNPCMSTSSSASSGAASSGVSTVISTNGKCGKGVAGCPSGKCCSYWGYCGSTTDYCGSGAKQCVCDCKGTKLCVTSGSNTGSTTSCTYKYVTASSLNQRTGPSTTYSKSGTLSYGTKVCVVSTSNGWSKLDSGKYVSDSYLSTSKPGSTGGGSGSTGGGATAGTITIKHTKVRDALKNSQYSSKADSLTVAFDVVLDSGYSVNCAIGLMANLANEGNYGIVEYAFSTYHNFGFYLPSGSTAKVKTIADIKYVRDWTTSANAGSKQMSTYVLKKGSCGFGSVQWSWERRVNYANICLDVMKKDSDVNDTNFAITEAKFIAQELKGGYYSSVSKAANQYGGSVEAWAEAFTDRYERPAGSDGNMSATGTACKTRRSTARNIYNILSSAGAI